jgi:hypothetical protein
MPHGFVRIQDPEEMRHIVYLLLIANVLYLGWNLSQGKTVDQEQSSLPPIPDGVPTLVMLQELAGNEIPVTNREDSSGTDKQADVKTDYQESTTAEIFEKQEINGGNAAIIVQTEQPDSRPARVCKALGPFEEFAAAETVSDRLASMGLFPMLRTEDSRVVDDYWIYLPGKGRKFSQKVIQQLRAENINDYYVYDTDDYLISLGAFRKIDLAERQLANFRQMGLEAVLEERYKTRVEHWLEISVEEKYDMPLENIAMETPGLQLNTSSCMSLAAR